jgi:hypothetical protein
MFERIEASSHDVYGALLAGLAAEFGSADDAMARHFIACEEADFHWEGRRAERYLGAYQGLDEYGPELDRVAITGCIDGLWYVGSALVDGEGAVQNLIGLKHFQGAAEAHQAFIAAC